MSAGSNLAIGLLQGFLQGIRQRQAPQINAFVLQLCHLLSAGLPTNRSAVHFTVMHAPSFFSQVRADVFGVGQHMAHRLQVGGLHVQRGIGWG